MEGFQDYGKPELLTFYTNLKYFKTKAQVMILNHVAVACL